MQHVLIAIASTCVNVAIRCWMKDKDTYIVDSVLDISGLARKLGCDFFSERHLDRNINNYINYFAEKLYSSKLIEGVEEERKKEILAQLDADLKSLNLSSLEFAEIILNDDNLGKLIANNSLEERKTWNEKEKGIYNNLVRFVSDAINGFVVELPEYSSDAIKVLYQSNSSTLETIVKQLDKIVKILDSTGGVSNDYRGFETDYLREIYKKNQKIEIFGSGLNRGTKRYDISTSYIELSCSEREYEDTHVELSSILGKHKVFWITGEAGSGKTTFVQWLTTHGISDENNSLQGLVPVFVKLRNCSFPFDLEEYIQKELKLECPNGWVKQLLEYDKLLLLLDGLDEISPYDRDNIYSYVEDLNDEIKTKSKIVITARPYVDDVLEIEHGNYKILRMNSKNIEKFVYYWHRTIINNDEEGECKARTLIDNIKKSSSLKSIAGTPLLCAMICALNHVSNETIPTNKNELYEKCCQMLIEDRDKERRIEVYNEELNKLDYTKKTILLSEISLFMLKCEKVEIEKNDVVSYIKEYIENSTIICSGSIKENPLLLIDYLIQRTGIIREPAREEIDYIHKTFMEYLGAKAIVRKMAWDLINKNLVNPFWKETIIMSFNQMNQSIATDTLETLLQEHDESGNEELLFMASLCAQNASDIEVEISRKIDEKIRKLIPPSKRNIDRLASAGAYIIPFLNNKEEYNDEERMNCLVLLDSLLQGDCEIDAIRVLISYLMHDCNADNVNYVSHLLYQYPDEVIEEHDIGECIYKGVCRSISNDGKCIISWDTLYLCKIPLNEEDNPINNVNSLTIQNNCECIEDYIYDISDKNYAAFTNVTEISIENINNDEMIDCIKTMPKIEKISLEVSECGDNLLEYLAEITSNKSIKELEYKSEELNYICDRDLESYRELRRLKLVIPNTLLEFEIFEWDCFPQLEQIEIVVAEMVYWEIEERVKSWYSSYPNIVFNVYIGE